MVLATLCYVKKDNKTLMIYRNKKPNDMHEGKWNGLGGKLEARESPEDCVMREIKEESGLDIKNPKLVGLLTFPAFDIQKRDWHVFVYIANEFSGELIVSPEGELHWINDDKILDLNLWESDHMFIKWIKEDRFFSAKFIFKEEKVIDYNVTFH